MNVSIRKSKEIKHVCSLSGGQTSTIELTRHLIFKYGKENIDFIFCDTGAEHEDTYRFIRDSEKHFGIKVTCLKLILPKEKGKGASYVVVDSSKIKRDYFAWKQLTHKYGNPFIPGGKMCTDQMKSMIHRLYCNDTYGKNKYYTWIGYRYEEGNRIWGKDASNALGRAGLDNTEKTDFYLQCLQNSDSALEELYPAMFPSEEDDKEKRIIKIALQRLEDKKFRFLPELSKSKKQDVVEFCKTISHDLKIDEHFKNCVYCPEKPEAVVMLAIKDDLEKAKEFLCIVESSEVPDKIKRNGEVRNKLAMYRKGFTFRQLFDKAMEMSRDDILKMSRLGLELAKKNPCSSGECSPFGDLHEEQIEINFIE